MNGQTLIDWVNYGDIVAGNSRSLDNAYFDAVLNDNWALWCFDYENLIIDSQDYGTPGAVNIQCQ